MTTLGELPPADWTAVYERTGRVEFPLRRLAFGVRTMPLFLFLVPVVVLSATMIGDAVVFAKVLSGFGIVGFLVGFGGVSWQLVTRKPALVVDAEGVRLGRRSIPWADFAMARLPAGPRGFRYVALKPVDGPLKEIRVSHATIQDLDAFTHWLNALRDNRRTAEGDAHADHG
ncbi:hypothetical protein GCM10009745_31980 [Kribbella yunnanensis]|uniref:PH domain-containing protein n=1 Tax=Kribbella yunnanensis TaxID=190194 RepID=A0ABP4TB29_9ACTN